MKTCFIILPHVNYAKAVLKFAKLNTVAQQREAVIRGRSLLPYRLRYSLSLIAMNLVLFQVRLNRV
ncbi:MAG: hypothetical protein LBK06_03645 [Planctomycetaceae bacterium]|nr:hypothetical protein [Planctomycetaceae bacterium]